jgi:hypothetical protein
VTSCFKLSITATQAQSGGPPGAPGCVAHGEWSLQVMAPLSGALPSARATRPPTRARMGGGRERHVPCALAPCLTCTWIDLIDRSALPKSPRLRRPKGSWLAICLGGDSRNQLRSRASASPTPHAPGPHPWCLSQGAAAAWALQPPPRPSCLPEPRPAHPSEAPCVSISPSASEFPEKRTEP